MKKTCIYTCITGDYDDLHEIEFKEKEYDYFCFTNNKNIQSKTWKVVYIDEDLDNLTLARKTKILGHDLLKKYEVLVWMDGAIQLNQPISNFLNDCCDMEQYDMIGFHHRFRNCIYDEMDEVVYYYKETIERMENLAKFYKEEKFPSDEGLIESTVFVRKNNKKTNDLMKLWFSMLSKYSRRDQVTFNYCLWKKPVQYHSLEMNVYDNEYFTHKGHSEVKFSKQFRVYFQEKNKNLHYFKHIYESTYQKKDKDGYYTIDVKVPIDCEKIECVVVPKDYVVMYDIDSKYPIEVDCKEIGGIKFFFKNHHVIIPRKFKKGTHFKIRFKMDALNEESILDILRQNNEYWIQKNKELEESFRQRRKFFSRVKNFLRRVKNHIWK